ncbi:MAG: hypothetical protein JSU85_01175 [Candidatus Zixiibacteriota bacterium]|nr:MAG: hypothetical protein JSU85_01175 [candidate division Zixibacteria bacterium]
MINHRVAAALTVTFVLLLLIWGKLSEKGYDTVIPEWKQQQRQALENRKELDTLVREDMAAPGVSPSDQKENMKQLVKEGFPNAGMPPRQLPPLGTWAGVRKGESDNPAFMKFDIENYRLWIRNPDGEDIREKGQYEFKFDVIHFKPRGKSAYYMDYYMVSKREIQLSGYNYHFNFEKDESIAFDF